VIGRLLLGLGYLVGAYVMFDAAADELGRLLGELFVESVTNPDNGRTSDHAD
jgi:hypothetical protein